MNGTTAGVWMNGTMVGVVLDGTNLDTGAAVSAFLANFDREGMGEGSFYVWIQDGESRQFQGCDENGLPRSLTGRFTDAQQVLGGNASAFATALQLLVYTKC